MNNINIQISTFQDHEKSGEHVPLTWAIHKREQTMERGIAEAN